MKLPDRILRFWQVYFSIEPWEGVRDELLNAMQCQSHHASLTGEMLPLDQWLPHFDQTAEERREAEMNEGLKYWDSISIHQDD